MDDERHDWKYRDARGCMFHDDPADCEPPVQAAHVIGRQTLRRHGLSGHAWDRRNRVFACYRAHRRSDLAVERFPVDRLPESVWEFAADTGLLWWLERIYGRRAA